MELTKRLRRGLALVAVAVLIFVWSLWFLNLAYDAQSIHCDTIDLWSLFGGITSILMVIGSCLFIAGSYFIVAPEREPTWEEDGARNIESGGGLEETGRSERNVRLQ